MNAAFMFMTRHGVAGIFQDDRTAAFSIDRPALTVEQKRVAPSVATASTLTDLLEVTMEAQPEAAVSRLELSREGNAQSSSMGNIGLYEGTEMLATGLKSTNSIRFSFEPALVVTEKKTFTVKTTLGTSGAGEVISLRVLTVECDAVVTVEDFSPSKTYVLSVPSDIVIDGAFEDWSGITEVEDEDTSQINNPNIDIDTTKRFKSAEWLYFYLQTEGNVLRGATVPESYLRTEPSDDGEGGGGTAPEPGPVKPVQPVLGMDVARVIIQNSTSKKYKLEAMGKEGEITSRRLYSWESDDWAYMKECQAENDRSQIEFGVSLADLGLTNTSSLIIRFETSDWSGEGDFSDSILVEYSQSKYGFGFAEITRAIPEYQISTNWTLFANDTLVVDTDSSGTPIVVSNATLNLTRLYYVNQTDFLYVRIVTNNQSIGDLSNATWMLFIDVDGNGSADWLVKENSTGLIYFCNWSTGNEGKWTWSATETLVTTDDGGGVSATTIDTYWTIDIVLNKSIILNDSISININTQIGAATEESEDFVVNGTSYQPTQIEIIPAGAFQDIVEPTQIPELHHFLTTLIFMLGTIFTIIRKRYKCRR